MCRRVTGADLHNKTNDETQRAYLIFLRGRLGLTQEEMASAFGMGLRAYSDMETGKSRVRQIYILAAERLTLRVAAIIGPRALADSVERDVRAVSSKL
jgi:transcriptional regulator with XRE-family HTH domain